MSSNHTGNVQNSITIEEHTHPFGDNAFGAKHVVQLLPAAFQSQKRMDYDTRSDDNPVYIGFNIQGAETSDSTWIVQKVTYDASSRPTLVQISVGAWDDRTTLTYT